MKFDPRFATSQSPRGYWDNFSRHFATSDEAHASFMKRVQFAESVAGRKLTRAELISGVSRPQSDPATILSDRQRRERELTPPAPLPKTSKELQLEHAQKRFLDSLPPAEKALRLAEQAVADERAEQARVDALSALLSLPRAQQTLTEIDKLTDLVRWDESVPQRVIDEINHQRQLLLTFGDHSAAAENIRTIRQSLLSAAQARESELKIHVDRLTARIKTLKTDFDSPPEFGGFHDGNLTATIRYLGVEKTIPKSEFDAASTGQLLETHFGVKPNE